MTREPVRTCVGCRERSGPGSMTRIARSAEGSIAVGRTAPGRGAWVHPECVGEALARGRLARALRGSLSDEEIATLRNVIEQNGAP